MGVPLMHSHQKEFLTYPYPYTNNNNNYYDCSAVRRGEGGGETKRNLYSESTSTKSPLELAKSTRELIEDYRSAIEALKRETGNLKSQYCVRDDDAIWKNNDHQQQNQRDYKDNKNNNSYMKTSSQRQGLSKYYQSNNDNHHLLYENLGLGTNINDPKLLDESKEEDQNEMKEIHTDFFPEFESLSSLSSSSSSSKQRDFYHRKEGLKLKKNLHDVMREKDKKIKRLQREMNSLIERGVSERNHYLDLASKAREKRKHSVGRLVHELRRQKQISNMVMEEYEEISKQVCDYRERLDFLELQPQQQPLYQTNTTTTNNNNHKKCNKMEQKSVFTTLEDICVQNAERCEEICEDMATATLHSLGYYGFEKQSWGDSRST